MERSAEDPLAERDQTEEEGVTECLPVRLLAAEENQWPEISFGRKMSVSSKENFGGSHE